MSDERPTIKHAVVVTAALIVLVVPLPLVLALSALGLLSGWLSLACVWATRNLFPKKARDFLWDVVARITGRARAPVASVILKNVAASTGGEPLPDGGLVIEGRFRGIRHVVVDIEKRDGSTAVMALTPEQWTQFTAAMKET